MTACLAHGCISTDVRVAYRPEDRNDTAKLESILLKSPLGTAVPLRDVAEVKQAQGPVSITRENQRASAQINGLIEGRDLGRVTLDVTKLVQETDPPAGYTVKAGGASQMMGEGFGGRRTVMAASVASQQ